MRKENSTVILTTTLNHGVIDFFTDFGKYNAIYVTNISFSKIDFFATFIPSEMLTLPKILFGHVENIFLLLCSNYGKKKELEKQVFNPKLV